MVAVSRYAEQLERARRVAKAAHDAMEAWLDRPLDAPDVPGEVLEGYARDLRASREQIRELIREQGTRDDLEAALAESEAYHRSVGLSIRDKPEPLDEEAE